ncbi:DUF7283 family protein [Natrarchaeobius oligotrophus]|uniref:Uncharacterized protein n=1 Tax=Natrarchaeobius chitinivorans TaxID=1679083 RepID=A0A3N6MTR2_NATCH|nr:hypothetical protein [Natrarchaeobius chitinivorans]RQH01291.1 hypothetical protein EA472_07510 [Natrarchaeobius chitinivorans]
MDLEAPIDAWYVWIGVSAVSIVVAGVVLGLPTGPPPDATGAINTIDRVAGSPSEASASHQHDAEELRFRDGKTLELRNEHGHTHSSLTHGSVVLVTDDERLENVALGKPFDEAFRAELDRENVDATAEFVDRITDAHATADGEWHPAGDRLVVRTLRIAPERSEPGPRITAEVTDVLGDWEDHEEPTEHHATSVRIEYDGDEHDVDAVVSARGVSYGLPAETTHEAETRFRHGTDSAELEFDGREALQLPISVDVGVDDGPTCAVENVTEYRERVVLCDGRDSRDSVELAENSRQIETDPKTGEYRVTLVVAQ